MIYTSYFSNYRKFTKESVSISRFPPKGYKGDCLFDLAPSALLLSKFKNNEITEEEYEKEYLEQLKKINLTSLILKIDEKILLCYEKKGDFCHRNILRKFLIENGIEAEEL